MVAVQNLFTPVQPMVALARALDAVRLAEQAKSAVLSVLLHVDGTFWIARRYTLDPARAAPEDDGRLRESTPSAPTRWDPPVGLDPRRARPRGLLELDASTCSTRSTRSKVANTSNAASPAAQSPAGSRAALVVSDRTVLGLLELHGVRARIGRPERSEALLHRVATQLAMVIASAPDPSARLLVGPRGVSLQSRELPLAPDSGLSELAFFAALRASRAGPGPCRLGLGLATVELEPFDGPLGPHLLVTLSRPSFFVVSQGLQLTTRQREIADLASHGLTVEEIAAATQRAPDTIKTHLKSVYRTLGVANRLELRELLDEG